MSIVLRLGTPDDKVQEDDKFTLHEASATSLVDYTHHAPGLYAVVAVESAYRRSR
jgi:hypothetical protein